MWGKRRAESSPETIAPRVLYVMLLPDTAEGVMGAAGTRVLSYHSEPVPPYGRSGIGTNGCTPSVACVSTYPVAETMNELTGGAITMSTLTVGTEPRSEEAVLHVPL